MSRVNLKNILKGTPFESVDPALLQIATQNVINRLNEKQSKVENREKNICRRRAVGKRGSFLFFCKHYFPNYFSTEFGTQQMELIHLIQSYRAKKNKDGTKNRNPIRASVAMSRGFGKSTILTLCGAIWLMLTGTWKFPILISSTLSQAKEFLQKIQEEIEDNQNLKNDYPELLPKKDIKGQNVSWSDYDLVFNGGFRCIAKGWGNAIRGKRYKHIRPDALLLDDPDEEKDVASESTMTRKYRWLERAALKLGNVWGIDVILSYTTIAPNCVGEYVFNSERYKSWIKKKHKAIEFDPSTGKEYSTWEAGAPLASLLIERDDDPVTFAQERQNEPLPEVGQKFKGLIQTWDFERPVSFDGWILALAVDLSQGKTERSDFSAFEGVGLNPKGQFLELYSDIQRRRQDQIMRDLISALRVFPWTVCVIESNGGQDYFIDNFKEKVEEWNELCLNKNNTDGLKPNDRILVPIIGIANSGDKIKRIESQLQSMIASGQLKIRSDSHILKSQLEAFPFLKKDGPDALEMSVRAIKDNVGSTIQFLATEQKEIVYSAGLNPDSGQSEEINIVSKSLDQLNRAKLKRRGF
ncbi:MAG: hypothetical protein HS129_04885 [Leptospiraceae bacterium]|nr:hypothetical protein [Leptospiraceae bacterium]